ncbi:hypothetical protein EU528_09305 [Candidatus Thorarchaeota archaeon]|nr:MAG: hypothetical protein EU528_09305 [Candidatus Thorarchaeota archaeon]
MSSKDDNIRTDEYWMGVRDALRMVDSFHKWSQRNPGRAKSLEDFIHDGLIAAAKRCESCLRDKLGLSFTEEDEEDELILEESPELVEEETYHDNEYDVEEKEEEAVDKPESSFEEPIRPVEPEPSFTAPPDISDESSISLDSVERREDESMSDLSIEGPPREFSTDFELVEPTPLVVDEPSAPSSPIEMEPESETEEDMSESILEEETETASESESEESPEVPSFTWSEYEKAVTPSSEPEPLDPEVDILPTEVEQESEDFDEEISEEPPEPPKEWNPYDEPSIPEEDTEDEIPTDDSESVVMEAGEDEPAIMEPPSPPPPPESEEDEEERKRRARRLFFGA